MTVVESIKIDMKQQYLTGCFSSYTINVSVITFLLYVFSTKVFSNQATGIMMPRGLVMILRWETGDLSSDRICR